MTSSILPTKLFDFYSQPIGPRLCTIFGHKFKIINEVHNAQKKPTESLICKNAVCKNCGYKCYVVKSLVRDGSIQEQIEYIDKLDQKIKDGKYILLTQKEQKERLIKWRYR